MKHTKTLMTAVVAVAVTVGGGLWVNQSVHAEDAAFQTQPSASPEAGNGNGGRAFGNKGGFGEHIHGDHGGKAGGHNASFGAKPEELAGVLGITTDELKEALKSGKTLAALAGEKGVDVQKVIDLQVKALTAKLDAQLAEGKLTQEQYDKHKANLTDKATKLVNGEFGPKGAHGGKYGGKHGHFLANADELAKLLGITTDELKEALKSGKTLAALAGEKGVDVQKVIDLQVKALTAKLDARLAEGKLTQEQYDKCKANLTDKVTKLVNGELGPKGAPEGKGHGKHGGKRHGDHAGNEAGKAPAAQQ